MLCLFQAYSTEIKGKESEKDEKFLRLENFRTFFDRGICIDFRREGEGRFSVKK